MKRLFSISLALGMALAPGFAQGRKDDGDNKKRPATAGQKVKSAASSAGQSVRKVARGTGQTMQRAARRTERVAKNTGQTVRNVARSPGRVARNTGETFGNVARSTGNVARNTGQATVNTAQAAGRTAGNVARRTGDRAEVVARNVGEGTRSVARSTARAVRQPVENRVITSTNSNDNLRTVRSDWDWNRDRDWDRHWSDRHRHDTWTNYRYYYAPTNIWRSWDRGRVYSWNNHRYHWFGGNWVIIDPGYAYNGPYYYDNSLSGSGSLVAQVQEELGRLGYDPGPVDGVAGYRTRNAIAQFQRDNGLYATGRIDQSLLNALDIG